MHDVFKIVSPKIIAQIAYIVSVAQKWECSNISLFNTIFG